jgi:hypothetical protein
VRRLGAEVAVVPTPVKAETFLSSANRLDPLSRTHNFLLSGQRSSSPMVKRPGCETRIYYSPKSTTEVKNAWSYTATPPICLHGAVTDNFTLCKTGGYSTARIYFPDIL